MTNKAKIKYLSQYVNLVTEFDEIMHSYEYFKNKIVSVQSQTLSDMPKASTQSDKIGGNVARLQHLEDIISSKLFRLGELRISIETVIGRVEESIHRRLLNLRYIDGMRWEEVAVRMAYSWQHIHRIHSEALNKIHIYEIE